VKPVIEVIKEAQIAPTPAALVLAEIIADKLEKVKYSNPEKYWELRRTYINVMRESLRAK